jgi:hypothetical protein
MQAKCRPIYSCDKIEAEMQRQQLVGGVTADSANDRLRENNRGQSRLGHALSGGVVKDFGCNIETISSDSVSGTWHSKCIDVL